METRARYVLIGLFSLLVIAAGFGFVYWLENSSPLRDQAHYRIRFDSPVSGLLLGSAVRFNGIRVGEVTDLALVPAEPGQVMVTIGIARDTPVRADTAVGLAYGGLTGVPEIELKGGAPDAPPPLVAAGEAMPLLVADADATLSWTEAAQQAFTRVDAILGENAETLKTTIANLDTFSDALARNTEGFDEIVAGLARLAGGRPGSRAKTFYDLAAATEFPAIAAVPGAQLVVNQPAVPVAFDTQQFIVEREEGEGPAFDDAAWSDSVPKLAQTAIVESFENAGYPRVGRDFQGLAADYSLLIDMTAFRIAGKAPFHAQVALSAKLVGSDGRIKAAERFECGKPAESLDAAESARALNEAFRECATALVLWALPNLTAAP